MAPRINKIRHDENTRARIQATQLVKRLKNHAIGKIEMSTTQVRAAEILLKKCLPDLVQAQHTGPDGGALIVQVVSFADSSDTSE